MFCTRPIKSLFPLLLLAAASLGAQDKITITVQRGTATRTATIEAAPATDAMKALDFLVATSCSAPAKCEYLNETDAIRKHIASWMVQQLSITPGTAIKTVTDAAAAAQLAADKARADYVAAAQATPIQ
jgi:hypothetical protein